MTLVQTVRINTPDKWEQNVAGQEKKRKGTSLKSNNTKFYKKGKPALQQNKPNEAKKK